MVGRNESGGDQRQNLPCIRIASEGWAIIAEGVVVPQCCDQALAQGARTIKGDPCDCYASEALTPEYMDDPWRGCAILVVCKKDTSPSEVLPYRLVYGIAAQRRIGAEVVDDRSKNRRDEAERI